VGRGVVRGGGGVSKMQFMETLLHQQRHRLESAASYRTLSEMSTLC